MDSTKKPHAINATFVDAEGAEKGTALGIYELKGDQLKIAWREKGKERPKEFFSKSGSGIRPMTFQRAK